jgi:hypothetical protein
MSPTRNELKTIEGRLASAPLAADEADRCAADLSRLGSEITAEIESEFAAVADAEPNAA